MRLLSVALVVAPAGGCSRGEVAGADAGGPSATVTSAARRGGELAGADGGGPSATGAARRGVELVAAPEGDEPAEALVRREAERARAAGRTLVVYLGAPWCEPCTRFHDAARAGALDGALPGLTVLEFDHERDADRLRAAGYEWRYIPLFARPGPDGRASGRAIEGSIKGEGAVAQIVPRLRGLLAP